MSDSRFCTVGFFLGCLWLVLVNVALLWGNQRLTGVWAYPSGLPMAGAGIAMSLGFAGCVIYGPGVLGFLFGRRRAVTDAPMPTPRRQAPTLPQEPMRAATRTPFRVAPQPTPAEAPVRTVGRREPRVPLAPEPLSSARERVAPPSPSTPAAPANPVATPRPPVDDRFKPMPMVVRRRTPLMVHERRDWIPVEDEEPLPAQPAPAPAAEEFPPGRRVAPPPLPVATAESFAAIEPLPVEPAPPVTTRPEAPPPQAEPARRAAAVPVAPVREAVVTRAPLLAGGSIRDRKPQHLRPVAPGRPEDADHSAASGRPAAALRSA